MCLLGRDAVTWDGARWARVRAGFHRRQRRPRRRIADPAGFGILRCCAPAWSGGRRALFARAAAAPVPSEDALFPILPLYLVLPAAEKAYLEGPVPASVAEPAALQMGRMPAPPALEAQREHPPVAELPLGLARRISRSTNCRPAAEQLVLRYFRPRSWDNLPSFRVVHHLVEEFFSSAPAEAQKCMFETDALLKSKSKC